MTLPDDAQRFRGQRVRILSGVAKGKEAVVASGVQVRRDDGAFVTLKPSSLELVPPAFRVPERGLMCRYTLNRDKRELGFAKMLGFNQVRINHDMQGWINADGSIPSWVWPRFDDLHSWLLELGMTCCAMFEQMPVSQTIDGNIYGPPKDPAIYARALGQYAARYAASDTLACIEPWNEPNLPNGPFWTGTAVQMAQLQRYVYLAVKEVAPRVEVTSPGFAYGDTEYLNAGGFDPYAFDSLAFHPYANVNPPEAADTMWTFKGAIQRMREWLDARGAQATPLRLTEFGWPIWKGIDPTRRADYLRRAVELCDLYPEWNVKGWCVFVARSKGNGAWDDAQALLDFDTYQPTAGLTEGMFV